jgi:succinyl-CoA synthetase alpha subunit
VSILLNADTAVLVQGVTGHQGRFETQLMLDYGTRVVAGTAPDPDAARGGPVPVYGSVDEAAAEHHLDASICYVPAFGVRDAVMEALGGGVELVFVPAERVPVRDAAYVIAAAKDVGARLIGPNTQGAIVPGVTRIGGPGGLDPDRVFAPGSVGVISRSGGMGGEISWLLKRAGLGTSTQVHIGGEALLGTTFVDAVRLFEADPQTEALAIFGERGAPYEEQLADFVAAGGCSKPIVAYVAGRSLDDLNAVAKFGHSGNIIRGSRGLVREKVKALENAGVAVARHLTDIPTLIAEQLADSARVRKGDHQ